MTEQIKAEMDAIYADTKKKLDELDAKHDPTMLDGNQKEYDRIQNEALAKLRELEKRAAMEQTFAQNN